MNVATEKFYYFALDCPVTPRVLCKITRGWLCCHNLWFLWYLTVGEVGSVLTIRLAPSGHAASDCEVISGQN